MNLPQPNSRHCFVCSLENEYGLKLRFFTQNAGRVVADYIIPECYQGYPGVAHGGVVAAMLDEAASRSLIMKDPNSSSNESRFMFTARLEIKYRRNVPVGKPIKIVGETVKDKGRTALAKAYLYDPEGSLLAEAEAVLIDIPEGFLTPGDPDELGWKVYPEG